jgi:hypothetical protein
LVPIEEQFLNNDWADTTESSQDSMAKSKMWNAVVANAKANNISVMSRVLSESHG